MRYSDTIKELFNTFPDIARRYKNRIAELYAEENPHVLYGSIFVDYIHSARNELGGSDHVKNKKILDQSFSYLEKLLSSSDFETRCLGETSVLEALLGEEDGLERYAAFMGPETKGIAREIARNWDLDISPLS
jgi:hypothetical protein